MARRGGSRRRTPSPHRKGRPASGWYPARGFARDPEDRHRCVSTPRFPENPAPGIDDAAMVQGHAVQHENRLAGTYCSMMQHRNSPSTHAFFQGYHGSSLAEPAARFIVTTVVANPTALVLLYRLPLPAPVPQSRVLAWPAGFSLRGGACRCRTRSGPHARGCRSKRIEAPGPARDRRTRPVPHIGGCVTGRAAAARRQRRMPL